MNTCRSQREREFIMISGLSRRLYTGSRSSKLFWKYHGPGKPVHPLNLMAEDLKGVDLLDIDARALGNPRCILR